MHFFHKWEWGNICALQGLITIFLGTVTRVRFFVNPKWAEDIKPPPFIFNDDCVFTQPIPILKIEVGDIIVCLKGKIEYNTTYSIAG